LKMYEAILDRNSKEPLDRLGPGFRNGLGHGLMSGIVVPEGDGPYRFDPGTAGGIALEHLDACLAGLAGGASG
jgi:hypothetical protein